jgi:hypothetical protein
MRFVLSLTENDTILSVDLENNSNYTRYQNHIDFLKSEECCQAVNLDSGVTITKILDDEYTEEGPCI